MRVKYCVYKTQNSAQDLAKPSFTAASIIIFFCVWAFSFFEGFHQCFTSCAVFGWRFKSITTAFASCLHVNTQGTSAWISFVFEILKIPWTSSLAGSRNVSRAWVAPGKMKLGTGSFPQNTSWLFSTGSSYLHLDSFLHLYIHHFQALSVSDQPREGGGWVVGRGDAYSGLPSCGKAGAGLRGGAGV